MGGTTPTAASAMSKVTVALPMWVMTTARVNTVAGSAPTTANVDVYAALAVTLTSAAVNPLIADENVIVKFRVDCGVVDPDAPWLHVMLGTGGSV